MPPQENEAVLPAELAQPRVSLLALTLCFLKLGTTTFGGGTLAWTYREVVERRQWIEEKKFLQMMTIAQVLPGPNPVNLAVYVGTHLRGYTGAALAAFGMIALPFVIILLLAVIYQQISGSTTAQTVLGGLACVGIAAMLSTGLKGAKQLERHFFPILSAFSVFFCVGVMRWSMILVVCVAVPVSILGAYFLKLGRKDG